MKTIIKNRMRVLVLLGLAIVSVSVFGQTYNNRQNWTGTSKRANCVNGNNRIACVIELAFDLANCIVNDVDHNEYGTVYLPILQSATKAETYLDAAGPFAQDTRDAVVNLMDIIKSKDKSITKLMTIPSQFNVAKQLKAAMIILERDLK